MHVHRKATFQTSRQTISLYRRLRELIISGKDFEPVKVFESDDEFRALQEEKRLIDIYGLDNLFNSTNVNWAVDWTEARRQAISLGVKRYAERCRQLYGKGVSPEHSIAISRGHIYRVPVSQETRQKMSMSSRHKHYPRKLQTLPINRKPVNSKSKFKGVSWNKPHCRWVARLWSPELRKNLVLGSSKTETIAATIYDDVIEKLFGLRPNQT